MSEEEENPEIKEAREKARKKEEWDKSRVVNF
jgi:hypothetical protein